MIKPLFLLAGGGPHKTKNTVSFLASALKEYGTDRPTVLYVGAASGDNLIFYTAMKALLHEAGAGEVLFPKLAKQKADVPAAKKVLSEADAIFLSGGEVEDGIRSSFIALRCRDKKRIRTAARLERC
jgi:peptidase E